MEIPIYRVAAEYTEDFGEEQRERAVDIRAETHVVWVQRGCCAVEVIEDSRPVNTGPDHDDEAFVGMQILALIPIESAEPENGGGNENHRQSDPFEGDGADPAHAPQMGDDSVGTASATSCSNRLVSGFGRRRTPQFLARPLVYSTHLKRDIGVEDNVPKSSGNGASSKMRARLLLQTVGSFLPDHYLEPTPDYVFEKALKDATSRLFFGLDRVGVHLLPKHFYTPVSDYVWLRENRDLWTERSDMAGIDWDLDRQVQWVQRTCQPYLSEIAGAGWLQPIIDRGFGPGFGPVDGAVLHCAIRSLKPRRIIEVGCGVSTAVMVAASKLNFDEGADRTAHLCIEPFPRDALKSLDSVELDPRPVQAVPFERFSELGAGDLLFIDSSHAVKIGSDVNKLMLEVIPKLAPGVIVHIHDIALPYVYPRTALEDYFGWQETALVLALMTGNPKLCPLASLSALHYDRQTQLLNLFPWYRPQDNDEGMRSGNWPDRHFPDSLWIEVKGGVVRRARKSK